MIRMVQKFCRDTHMKLSIEKTFILSNGKEDVEWDVDEATRIKEVMEAKYLGVSIKVRGRNPVIQKEETMISMAKNMAHTILNLTREGLDRGLLARKFWENCALPAILYATECMVLREATIQKLEEAQQIVGRFILQTPRNTARAAIWTEAGLLPIKHRIMMKRVQFYNRLMKKEEEDWAYAVLASMSPGEDSWLRQVLDDITALGGRKMVQGKQQVKAGVKRLAIEEVLKEVERKKSLETMSLAENWFEKQPLVNDSGASKVLCRLRTGTMKVGNREPN